MSSISRPPISHESSMFSVADTLASLRDKKEPVVTVVPKWWNSTSDSDLSDIDRLHRRKKNTRRLLWSALAIAIITVLAIGIWLTVIFTVAKQLQMPHVDNGISEILKLYQPPTSSQPASPTWLKDFSSGVVPIPCHSHNDYLHRVPLYEGLASGCISTEADIWIGNSTSGQRDLLIGHKPQALTQTRTLRSLYLDPLTAILKSQNEILSNNLTASQQGQPSNITAGVFSTSPNTSLILLLDFKTSDDATWETVMSQLENFRSNSWLTHWTPTTSVVQRPLTIVASGKAPFSSIIANTTYRDIFFDAPLKELVGGPYNSNNSYYASSSLKRAIGKVTLGSISHEQEVKIREQTERAGELGLKSRYWDIPSWPPTWRNHIWRVLVEISGVGGVLNVDDLVTAAGLYWERAN